MKKPRDLESCERRILELEQALAEKQKAFDRLLSASREALSIMENGKDLVFAFNAALEFTYCNPITIEYGTRAFGCSEEAFLAMGLRRMSAHAAMAGSDFADRDFELLAALFNKPRPLYLESNVNLDGALVWFGIWFVPITDDAGTVDTVVATARDITAQIEAQKALTNEKEKLAVTLSSLGEGVITTDTKGRVAILNQVAEKLTGWDSASAVGKPLEEIYSVHDNTNQEPRTNSVSRLLSCREYTNAIKAEEVLVGRDGRETPVFSTGALIRHTDGEVIGAVLVFRDISHQRAFEEEMHRMQKLESVGLLAGGIAHDFNNILTTVMGNLSLVQRRVQKDSPVASRLGEAEKAVHMARSLTNQLLTFSKGGSPIKSIASVKTIVEESVEFSLIGSSVKREIVIPGDLWRVEVDEGQISQVIQNLVINAHQAMPDGGTISVTAGNCDIDSASRLPLEPGQYVMISVRDQGCGIPKECIHRVFDPYFTTKENGTGLGLATTYSILRRHGGHITVESNGLDETCFYIYLPATKKQLTGEFPTIATRVAHDGRILVMDDEESVLEVTKAILGEIGFDVEVVRDGEEAVDLYAERRLQGRGFDVVIMDLTVPGGLGGKDAIKRLKALDPNARAVVSSGYSNDPVMSRYKEYGFCARVTKPYGVDQLTKVLNRILN